MNPYQTFSDVLFTCIDGPKAEIVNLVLERFNRPNKWSPADVDGTPIIQYFAREVDSVVLPYADRAESDTRKPMSIVFWEPRNRPGATVMMGLFHDGLSHSVFRLSEHSERTWINVRIYEDSKYPGCFFDFYSGRRAAQRRLMACTDEKGWEFLANGPVQSFENTSYYSRQLIEDRLNRAIITEYLEKLGYMVREDEFWATTLPASVLWQERPAIEL